MWCWFGGRRMLTEPSLCYSSVYYYNGAQRYEQFLHVGRLCWALILLGLALCLPSAFVSLVLMVLCIFTLPVIELSLVGLALNHRPSVLWHCWLGHLTHEIVPRWSIMYLKVFVKSVSVGMMMIPVDICMLMTLTWRHSEKWNCSPSCHTHTSFVTMTTGWNWRRCCPLVVTQVSQLIHTFTLPQSIVAIHWPC